MTLESIIAVDQQVLMWFNGSNSLFLDSLVPLLTSGLTWVPLYIGLLYLVVKNNESMSQIGLVVGFALLGVLLAGGVDDALVKPLVGRLRPCNDPMIKSRLTLLGGTLEQSYSFFSAHAANTMSLAVFLCFLVRDKLFNTFIISWSLVNCWTRLYLGVHYPSDVIVGMAYGGLVGFGVYVLFYKIYNKLNPNLNYISSQYTSTGYAKTDIDVVIAILVITIAVLIIGALINIWQ